VDLGLGMAARTGATSIYGYTFAFQANTGTLWFCSDIPNSGVNTELGMMAGTSPSISFSGKFDDPFFHVAFQANTGALWMASGVPNLLPPIVSMDLGLAMAAGTSPSSSGTHVAFQGNNGTLWLASNQKPADGIDLELGMLPGTSPSCILDGAGDIYIAFQANTGHLWITKSKLNSGMDTELGMMAGTSPVIFPDSAIKVPF
jgi:hypothetical protein